MQQVPGRRVARNPQRPLPRHGADSRRMRRHERGGPEPRLDRNMGAGHESPSHWRSLPTTWSARNHVARGVEPCGRTRALRTHETVRPSALGQVFEAGLRCGEALAKLPHVLRKLRSAHAWIVSPRPTGVNRRSISRYIPPQSPSLPLDSYSSQGSYWDLNKPSLQIELSRTSLDLAFSNTRSYGQFPVTRFPALISVNLGLLH